MALVLLVAGLTWKFGPLGLIGSGAALLVSALFVIDVKETRSGEAGKPPIRERVRT
jgi:hypothetical protein